MSGRRADRDQQGRFLPGNTVRKTHGAYSRQLTLRIRRAGDRFRCGLIADLGPEEVLTAAQLVLIEKSVGLYGITLMLERWIGREGVINKTKLNPVLTTYISHVNSLRLCLRELGIERRVAEKVLTMAEVSAEIEKEDRP